MTLEHDAYRYAIRNAYEHKGRADAGALIGKLKALYPDSNIRDLVPVAKAAAEKVNAMGMNEIHADFDAFQREGFELKIPEKKVGLLDLEWAAAGEPVVTRWAPNPSAPAHLGHLRPAILSYLYAKKYGGKFILRFDDTDPKLKKPMEGAEQLFLEDLHWVGCPPDLVARSSDRLEIYADYMNQIVRAGNAYVCTCEKEAWSEKILKHEACPCRALSAGEQETRLQKMFTHDYKEGDAVLRIKTDLNAEDPAERDWPAARIVDKPEHYRVQHHYVWPIYNFASAIDDHLMGVTLIIRGQQHTSNVQKQKWIFTHFGWEFPHSFHHGKLDIKGVDLSKSGMLAGIASGKYTGWDDPRLYTVQSLRRKGFDPRAFIDMMIDLGVKPSDTTLDLALLGNYNKPYVQNVPVFPLIQDAVLLEVDFGPALDVNVDGQKFSLKAGNQAFYVSRADAEKWNVGTLLRLRNAYVVKVNQKDEIRVNAQFVSTAKLENTAQTNWLINGTRVRITMPDGQFVFGRAGTEIERLELGNEVHFPQFGYCRVDAKTKDEIQLWYTHP